MRIDPKYFNIFLLIVAIIAATLIAVFTLSNRTAEKSDFRDRMFAQDTLQTVWWPKVQSDDSLRIADFEGQYVVLDFWANWTDASIESHKELSRIQNKYPESLNVIAASVSLQEEEVLSYIQENQFSFQFVAGSKYFSEFNVPGLPAQLMYNPDGELKHVFLGYPDNSQYDSLRVLINHGE